MSRRPSPLAPGWEKLVRMALDEAREAIAPSEARGRARVIKLEVRRGRGRLVLLWLSQPEDRELTNTLQAARRKLEATSVRICEECGRRVPRREPGRGEVLCEDHEVPF